MPCYSPVDAWQCADGSVVFSQRSKYDIVRSLQLPCTHCIGCRLERARKWAMRCMHEASLHERNVFVTLTYDDEHMPRRKLLEYRDFQLFMKRLRKARYAGVRFYMCGEYGPLNLRPHFHACLFGVDFDDKEHWKTTPTGLKLYRSAELERLWPFGYASLGDVTFESAGYVARYCVSKVTSFNAKYVYTHQDADGWYERPAEFNRMSLRPGIGADFFKTWRSDIFPHDYVVVNGKQCSVPKYYDKLLEREDADTYEEIKFKREREGRERYPDNTPERLEVKKRVMYARVQSLRRSNVDGSA